MVDEIGSLEVNRYRFTQLALRDALESIEADADQQDPARTLLRLRAAVRASGDVLAGNDPLVYRTWGLIGSALYKTGRYRELIRPASVIMASVFHVCGSNSDRTQLMLRQIREARVHIAGSASRIGKAQRRLTQAEHRGGGTYTSAMLKAVTRLRAAYFARGLFDEAARLHEQRVADLARVHSAGDVRILDLHHTLMGAYYDLGEVEREVAAAETCAEWVDKHGTAQPDADSLHLTTQMDVAAAYGRAARGVDQEAVARRGLRTCAAHPDARFRRHYEAWCNTYLGDALITQRRLDEAAKAYRLALESRAGHRPIPGEAPRLSASRSLVYAQCDSF